MNDKIGRNDPCWCGSGKKYKKCHLSTDQSASGPVEPDTRIQPGRVSPIRPVPDHIPRPDYVLNNGRPKGKREWCTKTTEDQIQRMRAACEAARETLDYIIDHVEEGITTDELDRLAHEKMISLGGYPSTLGYQGYMKSICTSINEVICHGIPDSRPLRNGEIVNIDCTIFLDGMHGDNSETVFVGQVSQSAHRLVQTTWECMMRGIEEVAPGKPFNAIGKAIETHAHAHGYSVVKDFTAHGIGEMFHMEPQLLHYYSPRQNEIMKEGMTFTVEPMINEGSWRCVIWPDDWTAVTSDLKLSAQFEHTVMVTSSGFEILTASPRAPRFLHDKR